MSGVFGVLKGWKLWSVGWIGSLNGHFAFLPDVDVGRFPPPFPRLLPPVGSENQLGSAD